jgi:hypothetical protein
LIFQWAAFAMIANILKDINTPESTAIIATLRKAESRESAEPTQSRQKAIQCETRGGFLLARCGRFIRRFPASFKTQTRSGIFPNVPEPAVFNLDGLRVFTNHKNMNLIKQTRMGENGNCLEACVSSLLNISLESFPEQWTELDHEEYWPTINNYLVSNYGYYLESVQGNKKEYFQRGVVIAAGNSGANPDYNHAVLWDFEKERMIFDPSPSNDGLSGNPDFYLILVKFTAL